MDTPDLYVDVAPVEKTVVYWGDSSTGEGVPLETLLEPVRDLLFDAGGHSRLFEKEVTYYPRVTLLDENGDPVLDINGDPIPVDLTQQLVAEGDTFQVPIVLTPSQNNGGAIPADQYTSANDDTIVAGRLELLHQAYIDADGGYDVLEVDAKGFFAQPLALLDIEEIQIRNLPNFYTYDFDTDTQTGNPNSIIDLNRAGDLEKLVVSESLLNNTDVDPGTLTVDGIRNGAETTLTGGFSQSVYLNYSDIQVTGLDLVFNNLSMGDWNDGQSQGPGTSPQLVVAHNTNTLTIHATGENNFLKNANLGGKLNVLNVTGAGRDQVLIQGRGEVGARTLLKIDGGADTTEVALGTPDGMGIIADEDSYITGDEVVLTVHAPPDLRAAELSGLSALVLGDQTQSTGTEGLPAAGSAAMLTLTDIQVEQMMAHGASIRVDGEMFHTQVPREDHRHPGPGPDRRRCSRMAGGPAEKHRSCF